MNDTPAPASPAPAPPEAASGAPSSAPSASTAALRQAMAAIDVLEGRLRDKEAQARAPVAVIGLGCRFAGGIDTPDAFWKLLREGRHVVGEIPRHRWDIDRFHDTRPLAPGKIITREGAVLDDVEGFDAGFFGISPREARGMDPQQRVMLEAARETFDHAGLRESDLAGSATGVFIGLSESEYAWEQYAHLPGVDTYTATGAYGGIVANRVSYQFDLKGPSFTVDSICSSSLLAVHQALNAIRRGECDQALAGGVCVLTGPDQMIWLSKLGVLSPTGRCRAYDAAGDGIVLGEGCAALMLKRFDAAERDGDRVLAVIRGSAAGQDGRSNGMTAPSRRGQEAVIRRAYADAGIDPGRVGLVDGHGTGTQLGDPIEAHALGAVVGAGRHRDCDPCRLGSVKTNLAHLGPVGGIASLMKVILSLVHRTIPPSLHFETPNPEIPFAELGLEVPVSVLPWDAPPDGMRVGAATSLAFGGTNVHLVVEEAPRRGTVAAGEVAHLPKPDAIVLPLSARSDAALRASAADWRRLVSEDADMPALRCKAAAQATRRDAEPWRAVLVADSAATLSRQLDALGANDDASGMRRAKAPVLRPQAGPVFVCSGHGAQHAGMALTLLDTAPAFREGMEAFAEACRPYTDWSLMDALRAAGDGGSLLERTEMIQPALCGIQIALAALWRSLGVEPSAVIGNSMGEVAAAGIAGILDMDEAARVICLRTRLLADQRGSMAGEGAMLMAELSLDAARRAIAGHEGSVSLAVAQGPRSVVLSGDAGTLGAIREGLEAEGVFCRTVDVDFASHSPAMDPLLGDLVAALGDISPRPAEVPFHSTVRGKALEGPELDAGYWADNLRKPVLFHPVVEAMLRAGHTDFVELSPHPLLTVPIMDASNAAGIADILALPSQHRDRPAWSVFLESAGALQVRGVAVDWHGLFGRPPVEDLPSYPWQRERYWLDWGAGRRETVTGDAFPAEAPDIAGPSGPARFVGAPIALPDGSVVAVLTINPAFVGWQADHTVFGMPILPAAAMLGAMGSLIDGPAMLADVRFLEALPIDGSEARVLRQGDALSLHARRAAEEDWRLVATALVGAGEPDAPPDLTLPDDGAATLRLDGAAFYRALDQGQAGYGPALRGIRSVEGADGWATAVIVAPEGNGQCGDGDDAGRATVPPPLLDACLQVTFMASGMPPAPLLPLAVERVWMREGPAVGDTLIVGVLRREDGAEPLFDVSVTTEGGAPVIAIAGLRMRRAEQPAGALLWSVSWHPAEREEPAPALGRICVIGDAEEASSVAEALNEVGTDAVHAIAPDIATLSSSSTIVVPCGRNASALALIADTLRVAAEAGNATRVILLTRDATSAGGTVPDPDAAMAWGFGRSAALEHPGLRITLLDHDGATPAELAVLLDGHALPLQSALRDGALLVPRLGAAREGRPSRTAVQPAGARSFRLELVTGGTFEDLRLAETDNPAPGAGRIVVAVEAAGLNFMDVARAVGRVAFDGDGETLGFGMECAGRVIAVGDGVDHLRPGDPVLAVTEAPRTMARFVETDASLAIPLPGGMDIATAAAQPIAYLTAHEALISRACLKAGETVLIHSAAGGVGLAAVAVAQASGARVVATAGSPEKRAYLETLGIEHVFDSRSLEFAAAIPRICGDVDVVLSALTGPAAAASLELLGPFGRFVEMGKADQQAARPLSAALLGRNIAYHAIDIAAWLAARPAEAGAVMVDLMERIGARDLAPLPVRTVEMDRAPEHFRLMARAQHMGKLVATLERPEHAAIVADPVAALRDGHALVTGGTGGLGPVFAEWLVERGARSVTLLARRAPEGEAAARIAMLEDRGVDMRVVIADVAEPPALRRAIAEAEAAAGPVTILLHAAATGDDAPAAELSEDRIAAALAPKVAGTEAVLDALAGRPLGLVVFFSSTAAVLGSPGQANYAAACAYLDARAASLRASGVPALSVGWGPWASVGGVARRGLESSFARRGQDPLDPADAVAALGRALRLDVPAIAITRLDPVRWYRAFPESAPVLGVGSAGAVSVDGGLPSTLSMASDDERTDLMIAHLRAVVAGILGVDVDRIDPARDTLGTLGIDSLMALELRNRLEADTGARLSATLAWNYPAFVDLAGYLLGLMGMDAAGRSEPRRQDVTDTENDAIAIMSDDEAEAELLRRLGALEEDGVRG